MSGKIKYALLPIVLFLFGTTSILHAELHDWGTTGVGDTTRVEKILQFTGNPSFSDTKISSYSDPWSIDGDWIVYTVSRYDNIEEKYYNWLYKIRSNGTASTKLTGNVVGGTNASFANASFASDGRIYFDYRDYIHGGQHIYHMNRDGTLKNLSAVHGEDCERDVRPSPDSSLVAYRDCSSHELRVVKADGTFPLTVSGAQTIHESHHDWSPDSQWLAYKGNDSGNEWVYIVKYDGTDRTALTKPLLPSFVTYSHKWPAWSPDGEKIAYIYKSSFDSDNFFSLRVVAVDDGSDQQILDSESTEIPGWQDISGPLSWSPDGKWVAYHKGFDSGGTYSALFIAPSDGSSPPVQLTLGYHDFMSFWSPDGTRILFHDKGYQPSYPSRDGDSYYDLLMLKMKGSYGKFSWPLFLPAIIGADK